MASILGDLAALELTKFYAGVLRYKVGTLVEVSMLIPNLVTRKVLRAPRCPVCSKAMKWASHSTQKADYMPGSQFVAGDETQEAGQYTPQERFGHQHEQ